MGRDKGKKDIEEALTYETKPGGYAMVSRKRAERGISDATRKYFDHEADRESGDNDPHQRHKLKKDKKKK